MTAKSSAIERLRAAGRRVTPERELLVRIINRNPHLDATEIYRIAQEKQPRIGLATVYRTLNLLKDLGVVRACELGEAHRHYEAQQDDHLHLVCSDCGRIIDIPPPESLRDLAASQGFHVERIRLELIGHCDACARKRSAEMRKET
jgi:Fur family peroxide stress response transcriptional regulator